MMRDTAPQPSEHGPRVNQLLKWLGIATVIVGAFGTLGAGIVTALNQWAPLIELARAINPFDRLDCDNAAQLTFLLVLRRVEIDHHRRIAPDFTQQVTKVTQCLPTQQGVLPV